MQGDAPAVTRICVDSSNAGFGARMPTIAAHAARVARWRRDLAQPPPVRRRAKRAATRSPRSRAESSSRLDGCGRLACGARGSSIAFLWLAERECAVVGVIGIGPSRDPVDPRRGEVDTLAVDAQRLLPRERSIAAWAGDRTARAAETVTRRVGITSGEVRVAPRTKSGDLSASRREHETRMTPSL
jgi:hypothetical protein